VTRDEALELLRHRCWCGRELAVHAAPCADVPFPVAMTTFPALRQSTLGDFWMCHLLARFKMLYEDGWHSAPRARGSFFHRWAAKLLTELEVIGQDKLRDEPECPNPACQARPNEQLSEGDKPHVEGELCPVCGEEPLVAVTLEDLAIDYLMDVFRQEDVPDDELLPLPYGEHLKDLEWVVRKFAREQAFNIARLVDVEKRLAAPLFYANPIGGLPVERLFTGQMDAVFLGHDESHLVVLDWKDTWAIPAPSEISTEGYFQQRAYAWLLFHEYPDVDTVTLREVYVRYSAGESGEENHRTATIHRSRLRMIGQELAVIAEAFDQAVEHGEDRPLLWRNPTPGGHCFSGDTRFLTDEGVRTLADACGERVRVLNRHGEWESAEVQSFGVQPLGTLRLARGGRRGGSRDEVELRVTPDHRWWAMEGNPHDGWRSSERRVTTVEVDRVPLARMDPPDVDPEGVRHGIVYSDGYLRRERGYCVVRLQPHKASLTRFFDNAPRPVEHYPGQVVMHRPVKWRKGGVVDVTMLPAHYKRLPERCTPAYARGFIAGLVATDGSARQGVVLHCEGREAAERIAELAVLGGCAVTSVLLASARTPAVIAGRSYPLRERKLMAIRLKPATVPFVRAEQERAAARDRRQMRSMHMEVLSYEVDGALAEVYCVVAPGSESFTLANGLVTSNCSYCPAAHDCPVWEGWDRLREAGPLQTPEEAAEAAGLLVVARRVAKLTELRVKDYLSKPNGHGRPTAKVRVDTGQTGRGGDPDALTVFNDHPPGLPQGVPVKHAKGDKVFAFVESHRMEKPDERAVQEALDARARGIPVEASDLFRTSTTKTMRLVERAVPVDSEPDARLASVVSEQEGG
jgi:hypothetical protein